MRADRFRSLQQRLRREADSFEFGALIDGVSTIEPEPEAAACPADEAPAPTPTDAAPPAPATEEQAAPATPPAVKRPPRRATPKPPAPPTPPAPAQSAPVEAAPAAPAAPPQAASAPEDRVRMALEALESRLLQASGRFRAAAAAGQAEEAGLRLADMNQILELLLSMDPNGDTSRKLGTTCAPPKGRTWPRPVWTLAEFAESPLSGMLPSNAAEPFIRSVFYSAWGVTFE